MRCSCGGVPVKKSEYFNHNDDFVEIWECPDCRISATWVGKEGKPATFDN